MAGKSWTQEEIDYLKEHGPHMLCSDIAKKLGRTVRATQHKFNELGITKHRAKNGDVVKGWKIVDIYLKHDGHQQVTMGKVESTVNDKVAEYRLSRLTNEQVGWPDRRRPDVVEKNTTHGESKTRIYTIWASMISRCSNPKSDPRGNYYKKGIRVCKEWEKYEVFKEWADQNGYSDALTIDRIDNNKNYCPENCRWASWNVQAGNRSECNNFEVTAFGETKGVFEWVQDDRCSVTLSALLYRLSAEWDTETALTKKPERSSRRNIKDWLKEKHPEVYQDWCINGY